MCFNHGPLAENATTHFSHLNLLLVNMSRWAWLFTWSFFTWFAICSKESEVTSHSVQRNCFPSLKNCQIMKNTRYSFLPKQTWPPGSPHASNEKAVLTAILRDGGTFACGCETHDEPPWPGKENVIFLTQRIYSESCFGSLDYGQTRKIRKKDYFWHLWLPNLLAANTCIARKVLGHVLSLYVVQQVASSLVLVVTFSASPFLARVQSLHQHHLHCLLHSNCFVPKWRMRWVDHMSTKRGLCTESQSKAVCTYLMTS